MFKNCLIAGPTNAGKTILCRRLVGAHGFSRISGDALILAFQESYPELSIGHAVEGCSDEEGYALTCSRFGRFLVRFMNALAWESTMPYALDTFHVRPEDLAGLETRKTQVVFLGYPEADAKAKARVAAQYQREKHGAPFGWMSSEAEATQKFEIFVRMSRELREGCTGTGYPFFDVSEGFTEALSAAEDLVVSQERVYDR